jgi:hypothetical protein
MRNYIFSIFVAMQLTLGPVQAQPQAEAPASTAVPVKGAIEATGLVKLLITIYDREIGGNELYSLTATLPVEDNTYFGMINVPNTVFQGRQKVYIEVARPSAPAIALEARSQFMKSGGGSTGGSDKSFTIRGCSLCYTCGGSYPIFNGAFVTTGLGTAERGNSCSGNVTSNIDFRPHLCCQTGSL